MRRIISLFVLIATCTIVSCDRDKDKPRQPETVRVSISSSISFNNEPDWVVKVQSGGSFVHVYDSINLIVTNTTTNVQSTHFSKTNSFDIMLTAGTYNMYMGTRDPKPVDPFLCFTASTPSTNISSSSGPVTLIADSKQALLLVTKAAVDAVPTMKIGTKTYPMYLQAGGTFYYAYVYAGLPAAVTLNMTISGKAVSRDLTLQKQNRYVVSNPVNATITNTDPISNVIQI